MCSDLLRLGDDFVGRDGRSTAAEYRGARGIGAATVGCQIGVGVRHPDVGLVEPESVAEPDLVHRLVALPVRYRARDGVTVPPGSSRAITACAMLRPGRPAERAEGLASDI